MSLRSIYRDLPDYVGVPLALLASSLVSLIVAALGAVIFAFLRGKLRASDDLDNAIIAFFFVAPGIAILSFVSCFAGSNICICDLRYIGLDVGSRLAGGNTVHPGSRCLAWSVLVLKQKGQYSERACHFSVILQALAC
jgi:hypothetical protein